MDRENRLLLLGRLWARHLHVLSTAFLLGLCALGAVGTPQANAEGLEPDPGQARRYLLQGIEAYKSGSLQHSEFYLRAAQRLDPAQLNRSAEAFKLEAFLKMAVDDRAGAAQAMVRSLKIRPDPFLAFLLGDFNLGLRSLRQARNAYKLAVESHGAQFRRGQGQRTESLLWRHLPFACPSKEETKTYFTEAGQNPFGDASKTALLWQRGLHPLELATAAYQLATLSAHIAPEGGDVTRAAYAQLRLLTRAHGATFGSSPQAKVLKNPTDPKAHKECILRLAQMEQELKDRVRAGNTNPSKLQLALVGELQRRALRNAIGNLRRTKDYFAYGTHALRQGRTIEALHALRRALARTELGFGPGVSGDLVAAAQIYRALEITYGAMARRKDAWTVAHLAEHIETHLARRSDTKQPDDGRLLLEMVRTSQLNKHNREGLLLLIMNATVNKSKHEELQLQRRLAERDARQEYQEMLLAFPEF